MPERTRFSLSLITTNALVLYDMFRYFWGQATMLPRRNHLLHDLITQVFVRSLQYGIVVMGFIDAFVYAHHQHRRGIENPGNFGDCIKGRIRFMTAITPAHAHVYQATYLTRHMPTVPRKNFRLPKPKARYPHLPNARTTTRERGNDFQGWPIYTDVCTRVVNGETLAGWGVIARSLHRRIDIMFGPVITTEAHPAFSGARTHSNNTADMTAMIEALSFLGPRGPVARDMDSCIYYDSKHASGVHVFSGHLHVNGQCFAPNTGYGLPCNTCMVTLGIWEMNVPIMPPHWGHSALCQIMTLLHVGFVITLILLLVVVINSISEVFEKLRNIRTEATSLPQDGS